MQKCDPPNLAQKVFDWNMFNVGISHVILTIYKRGASLTTCHSSHQYDLPANASLFRIGEIQEYEVES
jgi:hypothetical protein